MRELIDARDNLVTHNYVVLESSALIQRRLGAEAVRVFVDDVLPVARIIWIDEPMHAEFAAQGLTTVPER